MARFKGMTERHEAMLEAIRTSVRERGFPPSLRELMAITGITSTSVAAYNLKQLEKMGFIKIEPETSRGITLIRPAWKQEAIDALEEVTL